MSECPDSADPLLLALKKMGDVNIRALQQIVHLQSQVVTLSQLVVAIQSNVSQLPIEAIQRVVDEKFDTNAASARRELTEWLYQNDISTPKGDGGNFLDRG